MHKLGATPFEVLVYIGEHYFDITGTVFSLAVLITAVLFVTLIGAFPFLQNRHFFRLCANAFKLYAESGEEIFLEGKTLKPIRKEKGFRLSIVFY